MNVLVVDDNDTNRKLLRVMLAAEGHRTVERSNGLEALDSLERSAFDVLISDILMPGMDGYRLCYEIRRNQKFRDIPIIIYSSTYTSPADEQVALKAGADRFISRPAPASVLLDAIRNVSQARKKSPADSPAAPPVEPQVLKEYSERLVWKLEERNVELEEARARLSKTNEELRRINETLERDVSERKRAEEQVRHLAFHDALTGLPNRLLFTDRVTVALHQAKRHRAKVAAFFLDLDRFKVINDSLGHSVGDELLRGVAERLQTCVRAEDTVARLGGDEFILLVTEVSSSDDAATVAQKIVEAIRSPFRVEDRELFVTTSVGVAVFPEDGLDSDALVRNADAAMYRAKEQGRDRYQLCTPGMHLQSIERLGLESQLRQALQNDEFLLHYQPIVDVRTGEIPEVEALLRWNARPALLRPYDFISVAESSSLILPISRWVLQNACSQISAWESRNGSRLCVGVNLSARQFQQPDLVGEISRALREAGASPELLDLEITESSAMQNLEESARVLRRLKEIGVRVSLDDFGTGYSSLSLLKRLPIDRIKIDQSFVRNVTRDPEDSAIVAAVIAMARRLNLIVVAEGVETPEQLQYLKEQGCDHAQGYLFSHALAASELDVLLGGCRMGRSPFQSLLSTDDGPAIDRVDD